MRRAEQLITEHLELWSSAVKARSSAGRGSSKKSEIYGVSKLRELVLDLAIHGLLTKTNPNDEPIAQLLECINTERLRLEKEGIIRSKKPLPSIKADEKLFELPEHWEWLRLREIGHDWGQMKPETDFTYIDVGAINKERGTISDPQVLPAIDAPSRARKVIKEGTVIYSTVRPYLLNIAVVDKYPEPPPIASTAFAIIHPFKGVLAQYIYHYLRSPTFTRYVENNQTGTSYPAINDKQFFSGIIPIPPLEEQHRIVAKVDELMALCDQLEEEQENNLETHETLVSTLLNTLTSAAADATEFAVAWQRIQDNFDILFKTESSVDQLKQTILQLALMGKLVKQQESIDASSTDHSVAISTEEAPYTKPIGWEWKKIGDHVKIKGGSQPNKNTFINEPRDGYTRLIQIRDFKSDNFKTYIPTELANRPFAKEDVMIGRYGPPVFQILRGLEGSYNVALMKAKPDTKFINNDYLFYLLQEPRIQKIIIDESERTAGQSGIRLPLLNGIKYGLPPLGEQHLIVSKIEKLIALCDQLKESLVVAQATQLNLADNIVEQAIQSPA